MFEVETIAYGFMFLGKHNVEQYSKLMALTRRTKQIKHQIRQIHERRY